MHLIDLLRHFYKVEINWSGSRYAGITLNWDYANKFVDISVPNYTKNKLKDLDFDLE